MCLNGGWTSSHCLPNITEDASRSEGKQVFIIYVIHGRKNPGTSVVV